MIVRGYVVSITDLQKLTSSINISTRIEYLLNTCPHGSNLTVTKINENKISNGYLNTLPHQTIKFFTELNCIDHGYKVVLTEEQYNIIKKIMRMDNRLRFNDKIKVYNYKKIEHILGYMIKVQDLQKITMTNNEKNQMFFNLIPLGSNFNPDKINFSNRKPIFDDNYPKINKHLHEFLFYTLCIKNKIYLLKCISHNKHYMILSVKQYEIMKTLFEEQSIEDYNAIILYNNPVYKTDDNLSCVLL